MNAEAKCPEEGSDRVRAKEGLGPIGPETAALSFFATCPTGLEGVLASELRSIGIRRVRPLQGGVSFEGVAADAYRTCLWSRTASRILQVVGRVGAKSAESFYDDVKQLEWPCIFSHDRTIAVYAKGMNGALRNTQFTALKAKDAICDSFREAGLARPFVDAGTPDVRIQVSVHGQKATVYVDYAGESLHRRGYRTATESRAHEAPLKEALAAGMLLWAGWGSTKQASGRATGEASGQASAEASGEASAEGILPQLYDPVCGSGTLVIEGAMIASDMAPGLLRRKWGFEGLASFDEEAWSELVDEADGRFEAGLGNAPLVLGSDIDPESVRLAQASAKAMGLGSVARFMQADCADMAQTMEQAGIDLAAGGLVAMNPPYGVRLLEGGMDAFYKSLRCGLAGMPASWDMVAITPDALFDAEIGLDAQRMQATYNGPIEATIRLYRLGESAFRPLEVVTMSGREEEVLVSSAHPEQFASRLRKCAKQARKWAKREGTGAFRIYDRDLPDYSLSIDQYTDEATGDVHLMVSEYKAPSEIDPAKAARRFDDAVRLAAALLEVDDAHLHTRMRRQDVGGSQYAKAGRGGPGPRQADSAGQDPVILWAKEGGHRFEVHMEGALDSGLFLDHRPVRAMIEAEASGKHFLNLFAYTGSVSVYAAAGGAASTTTVDMNRGYLDWARRNMEANGHAGRKHAFVRADVLDWAARSKGRFDLVFVDPPTFSNSKSMGERSWDIQRDHVEMLASLRHMLAPGAVVYFSGNLRSFKLDAAAVEGLGYEAHNITAETIPEDFKRNPKVHFCFRLKFAG